MKRILCVSALSLGLLLAAPLPAAAGHHEKAENPCNPCDPGEDEAAEENPCEAKNPCNPCDPGEPEEHE